MIHAPTYMEFRYRVGFKPIFDSRGVMRGADPESKGARKWCMDNLDDNDYGYGWTGYNQGDSFMFYFRHEADLLAFKLRFRV